jgi:hypothetical protein
MARPEKRVHEPVQVGSKRKVKDASMEARYTDPIRNNKALKNCCQDVDESEVSVFKTHEDAAGPDLMVIECNVCHRKQYRAAVGPGRVGG